MWGEEEALSSTMSRTPEPQIHTGIAKSSPCPFGKARREMAKPSPGPCVNVTVCVENVLYSLPSPQFWPTETAPDISSTCLSP